MTTALVFSSGTLRQNYYDAVKVRNAVALRLGYPKEGTPIGGGRHVPPQLGLTRWETGLRYHPSSAAVAVITNLNLRNLAGQTIDFPDPDDERQTIQITIDVSGEVTLDAGWESAPEP